jgi:hypothetical protein
MEFLKEIIQESFSIKALFNEPIEIYTSFNSSLKPIFNDSSDKIMFFLYLSLILSKMKDIQNPYLNDKIIINNVSYDVVLPDDIFKNLIENEEISNLQHEIINYLNLNRFADESIISRILGLKSDNHIICAIRDNKKIQKGYGAIFSAY